MDAPKIRRHEIVWAPLAWIVLIAFIGLGAALFGAFAVGRTSGEQSNLWLDVAKSGIQVVAVGVAGGGLAAAWKALTERREAAALTREKIRAEFAELIAIYNGVKTVRRTLRSLGLDSKLHIKEEDRSKVSGYYLTEPGLRDLEAAGRTVDLTKEQAAGFNQQMQLLNSLQLGYEAKARQFEQTDLLKGDRKPVVDKLDKIESYLNGLVGLWEEHGWEVREGTALHLISADLQPLFRQDLFRPAFSLPMREITAVINAHLFGAPIRRPSAWS